MMMMRTLSLQCTRLKCNRCKYQSAELKTVSRWETGGSLTKPARLVPEISRCVRLGRLDINIDIRVVISPMNNRAVSSSLWPMSRTLQQQQLLLLLPLILQWQFGDNTTGRINEVTQHQVRLVGSTVFCGSRNFEPSHGICHFPRNFDISTKFHGILQKLKNDRWSVQSSTSQ